MKKRKFCGLVIFWVVLVSFALDQAARPEDLVFSGTPSKISLDLKGMDVVEVIKMLASKGSLNVVVGPNVHGKVTMFLKDVDIRDAFEIILLANNLASDRQGDILHIMTQKEYMDLYGEKFGNKKEAKMIQLRYAKAAEVNKALTQIKTPIGRVISDENSNTVIVIDAPETVRQAVELAEKLDRPTETIVFELNYAKAKDLKDKIQEMLTKGVGAMQIDERTNKIAVTDLGENIARIEEVVKAFDDKLRQVLIEAKIVEITLDDRYKLGIDWQAVITKLEKEINIKNSFKIATQGQLIPGAEIVIGTLGSGDYSAMVQVLKTIGDTNILSSPRITVLNNEEAKILVGSSEPYATNTVTQGTSTTTTATALTFLDIGIKLFVTPVINRDGFVTIKIKPEVSSKSGDYTYGSPSTTVPIVSTTHADTSVTVKDGHTIIIAGLIKDERSDAVNKVPLLGDIPVVGLVFKKQNKEVKKKEIVIFLTPRIISGETDYLDVPPSRPVGDKVFTTPEEPAFERRKPVILTPGVFKKKYGKEPGLAVRDASPVINTEEGYSCAVREKIMTNFNISKKETKQLKTGDRVTVAFELYSGGNLVSRPSVLESTNIHLNKPALSAVEKSEPFHPFPAFFKEPVKYYTLEMVYEPAPREKR